MAPIPLDNPELLTIFANLHAPAKTPSASTVSRDMKEIFGWTRDNVIEVLVKIDGKIHLTADGWTSPNTISYLGVTVQFVKDGAIATFPLDFIKLTKAHTGCYLAMRLAQTIQEFRLGDKVLGFTGDNGSNNDTLVDELSDLIPSFPGASHRVRCIAHVLNLVAKAILSAFCQKVEDDDTTTALLTEIDEGSDDIPAHDDDEDDTDDGDEVAPEVQASDEGTVEGIVAEADLDGRLDSLLAKDAAVARVAITKVRRLRCFIPTLSLELPFADEAFKESSMAQFINLNIPVALLKNLAQLRVSCDWAGAHVLDMLSSCEHLESLEIDVWCQGLELGPQQRAEGPSKAILPKLRTLIFRNLPAPTYLAHFVAPALTALDIQWEISPDMIPEGEFRGHLLRFLSQSGCQKSLHTLRLRESAFYCGELAAIILDLPSLQNLTLDRTHVQWYQFWEILRERFEALRDSGVDHEGGQWFPPLKVLELLRVPLQPLVLLSVFEFLYQRGPDPCKLVVSFETLQVPDQTQIESCWGLTAQRCERGRKATLRDFGISVSIASYSTEFV
ncbi:hypothetical protein NMY22_g5713 [Coprinellus aureogranulatus]|nr:hypothetical protein NMY22_g5713 [Coprinellus aureogranulatus]